MTATLNEVGGVIDRLRESPRSNSGEEPMILSFK